MTGRTAPAGAPVGVAKTFGALNTTASSTLTATTTSTSAGDLLVATIRDRNPATGIATVSSVTDSAGNHWVKATSVTQGTQNDGEIWYVASAAVVTSVTVKVSVNSAFAFTVLDITGAAAAPLDKTATNSGAGINASVGPTATTTQANEIAVADIGWNTPLNPSNQTAGYTTTAIEQSTVSGTATGEQAAWRILSAPAALSYAASLPSSVAWTGAIATFAVGTTSTPTPTLTPTPTPTTTPTTTPTPPPTQPHVMVIVEDTQEYGSIIGSSNAPYINNTLVNTYRSATNWFAVQHTSPNDYLELLSGANQGYPNGSPYATTTLVDELHTKGIPWQSYLESMPSNCFTGTTSNGLYDPTHNPFHYFKNYNSNQSTGWCNSSNLSTEGAVPYTTSGALVSALNGANAPAFVWITPNNCDNMLGDTKSGSPCKSSSAGTLVKAGDTWLSNLFTPLLTSTWFKQNGIVIITWSQGTTSLGCCKLSGPGGHVPTIVVAAANQGQGTFTGTGDHYGTLAAIEGAYGVGLIGHSADLTNGALPLINGDLTGAFGPLVTPGTISGVVSDSQTPAQPVNGAAITYTGTGSTTGTGTTNTSSSGSYTFSGVPPGTYTVSVTAPGFISPAADSVTVSAGTTATANLTLTATSGISGAVSDSQSPAQPVNGASVHYAGTGSTTGSGGTTTDSGGAYTLAGVPPGSYSVTASASGFTSPAADPVTVTAGNTATANFTLTQPTSGGSISGLVTDSVTNKNLSGATVCISTSGACSGATTTTATNGTYTLHGVPSGTYFVTASMPSGYTTSQPASVTVTNGTTTTKNFTLVPQPGTISGTVTDSTNSSTAIAGATVTYSAGGGQVPMVVISSNAASTTSAGHGTITIPGNHYGTLRAIDEAFGLAPLGFAANAANGDPSASFGNSSSQPAHVLLIMEENKGYAATLGTCTADPYLCGLASTYSSYTQWYGVSHPSLPNYLALDSGGTQGCASDGCTGPYSATDLGGQLSNAVIPWTAYMETMPTACSSLATSGTYAKKHNPFVYFTDVSSGPCSTNVVPYPGSSAMLSALDGSAPPSFVWITPNLNDDMHDGSIQQGDNWLKANLDPVLSSTWFTAYNATVIVAMDEHSLDNSGVGDGGGSGAASNSNSNGLYGFSPVTEGTVTVNASAPGYAPQSATVSIGAGATVTQNFALVPQPGTISGTVADSGTGLAISSAQVSYTGPGNTSGSITTGSDGKYSFGSLAAGSYTVSALASGYATQSVTVTMTPGANITQDFPMTAQPGTLAGGVVDSQASQPVNGATVAYSGPAGAGSTSTGPDGKYTLTPLVQGSYTVSASATNYSTVTTTVSVAPGVTTPQDFALTNASTGTISGTATDSVTNGAVAGAAISYTGVGGGIGNATAGSDGTYTLSNLAPDTYTVTASKTGYTAQSASSVTVTASASTPENFALVPLPGTISGSVVDQSSTPISGATVSYSGGTATTGSDGSYTLSATEGTYTFTASATGFAPSNAPVTVGPGGSARQSFTLGTLRDPFIQPFSSTSIWNMPIGSGALYAPASLAPAHTKTLVSDQHIIVMTPTAPSTALNYNPAGSYTSGGGGSRCPNTGPLLANAPIPGSFVVPTSTKNFPLSAVAADGHTLIQGEPFARCTAGGAATLTMLSANGDLYGDGQLGVDGGSGLSSLGGAIRLGELVPGGVISHALQIDIDGAANLYPGTTSTCYRWPATKCDSYGPSPPPTGYGGTNPSLTIGALLALPQTLDINSLNLKTVPGRMLATALQNYGAYIGNDAARSVNNIVTELSPSGSVLTEFQAAWGFPFETLGVNGTDGWSHDIAAIFAALNIVNNNNPSSIGGGGTPLQPLAPPLQGAPAGAGVTRTGMGNSNVHGPI